MQIKTYNKTNFHKYTFCIYHEVDFDSVKNLEPNYKSKSGSSYYFVENGVYRLSNHWSRVANCRWRIVKNNYVKLSAVEVPNSKKDKLGFAKWSDFHQDNDFDKLYFIEMNAANEVNYFHKNNENYSNQILRTSVETTKVIKQIRTLLEETAWAKYLNNDDVATLRKEIIEKMITTNQTFNKIRQDYL
ncbi:hypothetical protein OX283_013175 [Flavobacterium sp. SUN052]|uniref:hypothetical protein n=1 Tax=Flavobacterium sp. SUN052 TaxID=3002441 RepID=UPI00237D6782|nr:hypothetical protein [Flavobacterium sp. SUN052]MEC4005616.1 hypothetical protein [Flavobacterium sp. SUN052]